MSPSERMFCYGIVLGFALSIMAIQLGRNAAPPLLPSTPPTEVHPS